MIDLNQLKASVAAMIGLLGVAQRIALNTW